MSAQIINFSDEIFKRYGTGFLLCPRCMDQSCFLPIVEKNKTGFFISALQCVGPQCEEDGLNINIIDGYVQGLDG